MPLSTGILGQRKAAPEVSKSSRAPAGFTLLEVLLALAITGTVVGIAIPQIQGMLESYHLSAAVSGVSGAIQSTRYQAIVQGYPFELTLTHTTTSYQVLSQVPPATTFSNVGGAIPWSPSGDVTMSPSVTLQFSPNGTVAPTAGSPPVVFTLSNGAATRTVTVSGVGNVTVQ